MGKKSGRGTTEKNELRNITKDKNLEVVGIKRIINNKI